MCYASGDQIKDFVKNTKMSNGKSISEDMTLTRMTPLQYIDWADPLLIRGGSVNGSRDRLTGQGLMNSTYKPPGVGADKGGFAQLSIKSIPGQGVGKLKNDEQEIAEVRSSRLPKIGGGSV